MVKYWGTMVKILIWMVLMGLIMGGLFSFIVSNIVHIHSGEVFFFLYVPAY